MQESHLPIRDEYLATGDVQIESGFEATRNILNLAIPPTASWSATTSYCLAYCKLSRKEVQVRSR